MTHCQIQEELINAGEIPVFKGHVLSEHDLKIRKHILNLMCQFQTSWEDDLMKFEELDQVVASLEELKNDGLLILTDQGVKVTDLGKAFIRNICMAFDVYLRKNQPEGQLFSLTV